MPSPSTTHRHTLLSRARESEIIQQHQAANNGEISKEKAYEVLAMRRQPVRGL